MIISCVFSSKTRVFSRSLIQKYCSYVVLCVCVLLSCCVNQVSPINSSLAMWDKSLYCMCVLHIHYTGCFVHSGAAGVGFYGNEGIKKETVHLMSSANNSVELVLRIRHQVNWNSFVYLLLCIKFVCCRLLIISSTRSSSAGLTVLWDVGLSV